MRTISVKVFKFDELSDKAKERAREWYREGAFDYEWWDPTYEDAERAGLKITAFDLDRNRHAEGRFIGSATETADKILKDHGDECETYKTASAFLKERDELIDTWPKDENGEHENVYDLDAKLDALEEEFLRTILEEYSIMLQKESEYLVSDECVDENITINEYEFDENGKRI